jgi:hypothetical protein
MGTVPMSPGTPGLGESFAFFTSDVVAIEAKILFGQLLAAILRFEGQQLPVAFARGGRRPSFRIRPRSENYGWFGMTDTFSVEPGLQDSRSRLRHA